MKILVVCQYYYPEPFRITDICEELVKRGHKVTVITGLPNYPMGKIYDGYRCGQKRDEIINGVNVHRCLTIERRSGAFYRLLNYYSYAISSTHYAKGLKDEYDVVFVNQLSPIMMASAGIAYKKKHQKKLVLYCLDLWPESLVAGGIKRNSVTYRYFHGVSSRIYRAADKILISSKSFSKYLKENFGIDDTEYLPQYAEAIFSSAECKKEPNESIDLMFAGNLGAAQSVDTIIRAAAYTLDIPNLRWHIVGDGSELENLKELSRELKTTNVVFHGRQPLEEMPRYYAMADAMLVTMKHDPVLSMTLPGKIQTYMSAGKPIIGAIEGEAMRAIEESVCGICCEPNDGLKLAVSVKCFVNLSDHDKAAMSTHSSKYYCNNFDKNSIIEEIESQLNNFGQKDD